MRAIARSRIAPALVFLLTIASSAIAAAEPTGRFAVISDIHFDPLDPPELAGRLAAADAGAWDAILATIPAQQAATYGRDTNYALWKSAIAAFAEAAADADFAIVPGDFLSHDFDNRAAQALGTSTEDPAVRALAIKTAIFVAEGLGSALPGKALVLGLGNDDSDCGDYRIEPGGPFLAETADTVRNALGPVAVDADFDATYKAGGYFAVRHPTVPGIVVVVLNDVLWSAKYENTCAPGAPDAGAAMLEWVEARLEKARTDGDTVWMVRHIPFGIDAFSTLHRSAPACPQKVVPFFREPYATRYPQLMRLHADSVLSSLAGHIHHDSYRLLADADGSVLDVEKIVPAISPIFGQNPGFQIFDYDRGSGAPTGFETWYLTNLDAVSLAEPGAWRKEYDFATAYGLTGYSAASVAALWQAAREPGDARRTFGRLYNVGHGPVSDEDLPAYLCAIRYTDAKAFTACYCGG